LAETSKSASLNPLRFVPESAGPQGATQTTLAIVRRDTDEGYRAMLERLAAESGIVTPRLTDAKLRQCAAKGE
jgi:hypothetical protein